MSEAEKEKIERDAASAPKQDEQGGNDALIPLYWLAGGVILVIVLVLIGS